MNDLAALHQAQGAQLAPDGIPLHYGDLASEYAHALTSVVLLDRSHEGRVLVSGADAFTLLNRLGTNKLDDIALGAGRMSLFTTPHARILERASIFHTPQGALCTVLPAHASAFAQYIGRNIFFNDSAQVRELNHETRLFALHGTHAEAVIQHLGVSIPSTHHDNPLSALEWTLADTSVTLLRQKPLLGGHWQIICPHDAAPQVYQALLAVVRAQGGSPAGSLTYNVLRIQSGVAGVPELNEEYIPLELGLWDEVSFHKGCYTGQEIIARMESRAKLARALVRLHLEAFVPAPAPVSHQGVPVGTLTSAVTAPDGTLFAMAVLKTNVISADTPVSIGTVSAHVGEILGAQARFITEG